MNIMTNVLPARALKLQKASTFVPELLEEDHTKAHTTEDIVEIFRTYSIILQFTTFQA